MSKGDYLPRNNSRRKATAIFPTHLPVDIDAIKAVLLDQVDTVLGEPGASRSRGRHRREGIGQGPAAQAWVDLGTRVVNKSYQALVVLVMIAYLVVRAVPRAVLL